MEVVGHNDLGGRGFNADVWVHDGVAYVGHWGFADWATGNARFCPEQPDSGVAALDVSDPANPTVMSHLQNPPGTSAEDVVVYTAAFGPFEGRDIAAAGIQVCGGSRYDTSFQRGLMLRDVTDPAAPVELGLADTGCCTRGVHELEIEDRRDLGRPFAFASVPTSEYEDSASPSGRRDQAGRGEFRLIDIAHPTAPVTVSDWGVVKDAAARSDLVSVAIPTRSTGTAPSRPRRNRRVHLLLGLRFRRPRRGRPLDPDAAGPHDLPGRCRRRRALVQL